MRSERRVVGWMGSIAAGLSVGVSAAAHAQTEAAPPAPLPPVTQVEAAVERLRQDPNLPGTELQRARRLMQRERPVEPDVAPTRPTSPSSDALRDFAKWLSSTGRLLVWALGALGVIFVLLSLRHWVRERAQGRRAALAAPPSHVRDLDIRPESLPPQIGAEARALWQRGEQRPALSLLYRGALSRLVHDHGVAIRAASTEGDCLRLARAVLDAPRGAYVERLIRAWQLAVYGGRMPADDTVFALCDDFDAHLSATPATPTLGATR